MKRTNFDNFKYLRKAEEFLMAKKVLDKKALRKKVKKDIENRISAALADVKAELGPKNFQVALKKASKAFLGKLKKPGAAKAKPAKTKLSAKKLSAVVSDPVK